MANPLKKSRKLAWVMLGVVVLALAVLVPVLYDLLWVEVPASFLNRASRASQSVRFREYESRLTGSRRVVLEDVYGKSVISWSSRASVQIGPLPQGAGPVSALGRWKLVRVIHPNGSTEEAIFEAVK